MPIANTSFLDEDCSDISDWADQDADTGESTQVTFDSKSCFKFDSGASTASPYARRAIDVGDFGDRVVISLSLHFDAIGTLANSDLFEIYVVNADVRAIIRFASDGLFIYDGAANNEVGTNIVVQDTWQEWTFDIDFTTPASATVDVYLDGSLVGDGIDCSDTGTFANDGMVRLTQYGYATANRISYVDWVKVGTGFYNALSINDSVSLSDGIVKRPGLAKADTLNLSDGFSKVVAFKRTLADTVNLADSFSRVAAFSRTNSDAVNLTDLMVKNLNINKGDIINLLDGTTRKFGKNIGDTVSLSDLFSYVEISSVVYRPLFRPRRR